MSTIANSYSIGLEQVAPVVADYTKFDDSLAKMLEPSKTVKIGRYLYRVPFKQYRGGAAGKHIGNSGTFSTGTGPVFSHFTAGYIYSHVAHKISQEQIDTSQSSEVARVNVLTELLGDVTKVLNQHDNVWLFNDGTGVLTNGSDTKPSSTTLTFNGATDGIKTNRLFMGMQVDVWDSGLTSKRANGPFIITAIDESTKTVTFSAAPTTLTAGDIITVVGLDSYGPAGPTTGSSTWPGGGTSSADGLTGDSWMHGLEYVNNITKSYFLGKATASYPQLVPQYENASASSALTYEHGESLKNKLIQSRPDVVGKLMFVMHQDRRLDLQIAGISLKRDMVGPNPKLQDLMPGNEYGEVFPFCGQPAFVSSCADRKRVDGFVKGNWTRTEAKPAGFHKNPGNGQYFFESRNGEGAITNSWNLYTTQAKDWVCEDPGAGGFIYGLPAS